MRSLTLQGPHEAMQPPAFRKNSRQALVISILLALSFFHGTYGMCPVCSSYPISWSRNCSFSTSLALGPCANGLIIFSPLLSIAGDHALVTMTRSTDDSSALTIHNADVVRFVGCGVVTPQCLANGWDTCVALRNASETPSPAKARVYTTNTTIAGRHVSELILSNPQGCYTLAAGRYDLCEALKTPQPDPCVLEAQRAAHPVNESKNVSGSIVYNRGCFDIEASDLVIQNSSFWKSLVALGCRATCQAGNYSQAGENECFPCPRGTTSGDNAAYCNPLPGVTEIEIGAVPDNVRQASGGYGRACTASGEYFACGATAVGTGLVAVYKMDVERRKVKLLQIISPVLPSASGFGESLDMDCNLLVVGAKNYHDGSTTSTARPGRVWVFQRDGNDHYQMLGNMTAPGDSAGAHTDTRPLWRSC